MFISYQCEPEAADADAELTTAATAASATAVEAGMLEDVLPSGAALTDVDDSIARLHVHSEAGKLCFLH